MPNGARKTNLIQRENEINFLTPLADFFVVVVVLSNKKKKNHISYVIAHLHLDLRMIFVLENKT